MTYEIRPSTDEELEAHGELREQGYGFRPPYGARVMDEIRGAGLTNRVLGAYDRGRLLATLTTYPFGQFFGGRPVPMGGVGGVVVLPEHRGQGIAAALLRETISLMGARGEVISALGPATIGVYRRAGWELAGDRCWRTVSTVSLATLEPAVAIERRAVGGDHDSIKRCYVRWASQRPGMLARPARVWEARLDRVIGSYCYVAIRDESVVGYVTYQQQRTMTGYTLTVNDFAADDWDAERCLWRHLGAHRAQAREVITSGMQLDALMMHLGENSVKTAYEFQWMLRIVDAVGAVAARGFPPEVSATVPVRILDATVAHNSGVWLLEVASGRATLTPGGSGSVELTCNALASLYSGLCSARTLATNGSLQGATGEQLSTLDALFSGPRPTMNDDF